MDVNAWTVPSSTRRRKFNSSCPLLVFLFCLLFHRILLLSFVVLPTSARYFALSLCCHRAVSSTNSSPTAAAAAVIRTTDEVHVLGTLEVLSMLLLPILPRLHQPLLLLAIDSTVRITSTVKATRATYASLRSSVSAIADVSTKHTLSSSAPASVALTNLMSSQHVLRLKAS